MKNDEFDVYTGNVNEGTGDVYNDGYADPYAQPAYDEPVYEEPAYQEPVQEQIPETEYADYDQNYEGEPVYVEPEAEAEPAPQPKKTNKKKKRRKSYGRLALGSMATALVLLILLIVVAGMNISKSSKESQLEDAYEAYTAGDETAKDTILSLSKSYSPAKIVLEMINSEETPSATPANSFGDSTQTETTTTDENATVMDSSVEEEASVVDDVAEPESEDAEEGNAEVEAAVTLWEDGSYADASTAFDTLAAQGVLSFDPSEASSGDAILSYAAVTGMLDIYRNVSNTIYYTDVVVYMYNEQAVAGYDLTKPVIAFSTQSGTFLCAYAPATNKYAYFANSNDDSEMVSDVQTGTEYDVLSISTVLSIRKTLQ